MRKIPVGTAQPRGLAAFKTVQKKVQRGHAEAQARQDFVSIPLKIGCITMWAIAGLFLFSLMRPAAEPMGAETEARPESPAATPAQAALAAPAAATPAAQTAAAPAAPAVPAAAAPAAPKAQPPAADQCGCLAGFGWSLTTGRGCCKAGSITQPHELAACQAALGNTDCTPPAAASAAADQCGCLPGFGWSLTTGRGCCKAGSITQPEELAGCRATLGNTDCAPAAVAADKDQCGCLAGFGWSLTTGRGCCKAGSITQPQELADCQATLGNTDCVPAPAAKDVEADAAAVAKDSDAAAGAAAVPAASAVPASAAPTVPAAASEPAAVPAVADACGGEGSGVRQYLHELQEEKSRVGYGRLGKGNSLGFEGITPRVKGVACKRMQPNTHSAGFVWERCRDVACGVCRLARAQHAPRQRRARRGDRRLHATRHARRRALVPARGERCDQRQEQLLREGRLAADLLGGGHQRLRGGLPALVRGAGAVAVQPRAEHGGRAEPAPRAAAGAHIRNPNFAGVCCAESLSVG